ncbi:MAG: hypothetical protein J0L56_02785 [Chitinophagales bacterium]|nr:hypothetical protein [Chitinophagales bacterium]
MQKQVTALPFLLLFFTAIRSQPPAPEAILDSINAGRKPEKIYTHFDQGFYQPGETIWFKTYIVVDGFPGTYSTVAKAELVNEKDLVIASLLIPVTAGTAYGAIHIPDSAATGSYLFRLYTQHMLAMKTTPVYYKPVLIAPSGGCYIPDLAVTTINLQFFPEGGTFLANELNNLAFTATDQHHRPAAISGVIKDDEGNEVTRFSSSYNGMGKVEIKPSTGKAYTATFSLPSGSSSTVALPAVSEEGTNMFVINDSLQKQLFIDSRYSTEDKQPAFIVGEMDQTIVFKTDIRKNKGHYFGTFSTKDLPGGLLHIAVFSASNQLLAERTCFISSRMDTTAAELINTSINLAKRGYNSLTFALPDSLEGSFSVSITNAANSKMPVAQEDIAMGLLVTSCLKAVPNLPFYNLGSSNNPVNEAVDLLLLTHDYKWNWDELKGIASLPAPSFNDFFITLRGKAYSDRNSSPILNSELSFIIQTKDSAVNYFPVNTDDKGSFEVPGLFFTDTATLFVKNNKEKNRDKKVKLELVSPPLADLYKLPVYQQEFARQRPLFYQQMRLLGNCNSFAVTKPIDFDTSGIVLRGVTVKAKTKNSVQLLEEKYTKGLFSSSARTTIDFINEKPVYTGGNIFDYLKGRYSYMQVMGTFPNYTLVFRNMRSIGTGTYITMAMFLDEMPVDASILTTIPMKDIALVRIYPSGIMGVGGALAVYTKQGDDRLNNDELSYLSKIKISGFSNADDFYSPDYANRNDQVKNDNRKTLYWNPSLIYLPEDGKVPFSFFNSDKCTSYRILVQGITSNGKFVRIEKIINQ